MLTSCKEMHVFSQQIWAKAAWRTAHMEVSYELLIHYSWVCLTPWVTLVCSSAAQANGLAGHKPSGQAAVSGVQTQELLQQVREALIKHASVAQKQICAEFTCAALRASHNSNTLLRKQLLKRINNTSVIVYSRWSKPEWVSSVKHKGWYSEDSFILC